MSKNEKERRETMLEVVRTSDLNAGDIVIRPAAVSRVIYHESKTGHWDHSGDISRVAVIDMDSGDRTHVSAASFSIRMKCNGCSIKHLGESAHNAILRAIFEGANEWTDEPDDAEVVDEN